MISALAKRELVFHNLVSILTWKMRDVHQDSRNLTRIPTSSWRVQMKASMVPIIESDFVTSILNKLLMRTSFYNTAEIVLQALLFQALIGVLILCMMSIVTDNAYTQASGHRVQRSMPTALYGSNLAIPMMTCPWTTLVLCLLLSTLRLLTRISLR